jgi:hypothetical protein
MEIDTSFIQRGGFRAACRRRTKREVPCWTSPRRNLSDTRGQTVQPEGPLMDPQISGSLIFPPWARSSWARLRRPRHREGRTRPSGRDRLQGAGRRRGQTHPARQRIRGRRRAQRAGARSGRGPLHDLRGHRRLCGHQPHPDAATNRYACTSCKSKVDPRSLAAPKALSLLQNYWLSANIGSTFTIGESETITDLTRKQLNAADTFEPAAPRAEFADIDI